MAQSAAYKTEGRCVTPRVPSWQSVGASSASGFPHTVGGRAHSAWHASHTNSIASATCDSHTAALHLGQCVASIDTSCDKACCAACNTLGSYSDTSTAYSHAVRRRYTGTAEHGYAPDTSGKHSAATLVNKSGRRDKLSGTTFSDPLVYYIIHYGK